MEHLLTIWPTQKALAEDLGLPAPTVGAWAQRGIPPRRFVEIISAAKRRGHDLSFEQLMGLSIGAQTAASTSKEPAP